MSPCSTCLDLRSELFPEEATSWDAKAGARELTTTSQALEATANDGCDNCQILLNGIQACAIDVSSICQSSWDTRDLHKLTLQIRDGDTLKVDAVWDIQNAEFDAKKPRVQLEFFCSAEADAPSKGVGIGRDVPTRLTTASRVGVMKDWTDNCRDNHTACSKVDDAPLPKRVLDVFSGDSRDELSLLETTPGQVGEFVTLSHCWGSELFIQTTKATLVQRKNKIDWTDLPRTFQDAITMTREMDLRYIWIDSLCIVQDDKDDWEEESAKMAAIYSKSVFTIAATGPANTGCFSARTAYPSNMNWDIRVPVHSHQVTPPRNPALKVFARLRLDPVFIYFTIGVTVSLLRSTVPLLSRAWVFQERFLSPRVVHFHPSCLVWECSSALMLESHIDENFNVRQNEQDVQIRLKHLFAKLDSPSVTLLEIQNLWLSVVEEYSRMNLTYETDRLPALSGVAQRFSSFCDNGRMLGDYMAGMWRSDLLRSLLWCRSAGPASHFSRPRPPTWAWTSVSRADERSQLFFRHDEISYGSIDMKPREFIADSRLEIIEATCEPLGKNPFGHAKGGMLQIKGTAIAGILIYEPTKFKVPGAPMRSVLLFDSAEEDGWILVEKRFFWEDVTLSDDTGSEHLPPGTSLECLFIGTANEFDYRSDFAMVLKDKTEPLGSYERVGLLLSDTRKTRIFDTAMEKAFIVF